MAYIYIFALFYSILLVLNDTFETFLATRAVQLYWIRAGFSQRRHSPYLPESEENHFRNSVRNRRLRNQEYVNKSHIEIVGDSHVRDLAGYIKSKHESVMAYFKPGANMEALTHNLNVATAHLTPNDALVFIGGTNNFQSRNNVITAKYDSQAFKNVLSQSLHTNIIVTTVPHRYDKPANSTINEFNMLIRKEVEEFKRSAKFPDRVKILDINEIIKTEDHYKADKLHLNANGKEILAQEIVKYVNHLF